MDIVDKNTKALIVNAEPGKLVTETFGEVFVGQVTVSIIKDMGPTLESSEVRDDALSRKLFGTLIRIPDSSHEAGGRSLTDAELQSVSEKDIANFARFVLKRESPSAAYLKETESAPTKSLAIHLRSRAKAQKEEQKRIQEAWTRASKAMGKFFSPETQKLFDLSVAATENVRQILSRMDVEKVRRFAETSKRINQQFKVASPAPTPFSGDRAFLPEVRTAKAATDLVGKTDEALLVVKEIADMLTSTNNTILSAAGAFAEKRTEDRATTKHQIMIAMVAVVVSALLAFVMLYQDKDNYENANIGQTANNAELAEQTKLLREIAGRDDRIRKLEDRIRGLEKNMKEIQIPKNMPP